MADEIAQLPWETIQEVLGPDSQSVLDAFSGMDVTSTSTPTLDATLVSPTLGPTSPTLSDVSSVTSASTLPSPTHPGDPDQMMMPECFFISQQQQQQQQQQPEYLSDLSDDGYYSFYESGESTPNQSPTDELLSFNLTSSPMDEVFSPPGPAAPSGLTNIPNFSSEPQTLTSTGYQCETPMPVPVECITPPASPCTPLTTPVKLDPFVNAHSTPQHSNHLRMSQMQWSSSLEEDDFCRPNPAFHFDHFPPSPLFYPDQRSTFSESDPRRMGDAEAGEAGRPRRRLARRAGAPRAPCPEPAEPCGESPTSSQEPEYFEEWTEHIHRNPDGSCSCEKKKKFDGKCCLDKRELFSIQEYVALVSFSCCAASSNHAQRCVVHQRQDLIPVSSERRRRTNQLWHFLLELLANPAYAHRIYWVDRRAGVFRFLASQEVAKLWGARKQKESMSYEYMSRAMRHYYAPGIMRRIPDKRLTYQFGPNAENWKFLAGLQRTP